MRCFRGCSVDTKGWNKFAAALALLWALLALPNGAFSETPPAAGAGDLKASSPDALTRLGEEWDNLGRLYYKPDNDVLQEVWLLGRYQGQYHWTEANTGESDGYETRRFRLGGQVKAFKKMTLHAQMVSGSDIDPFYNGFTELWVHWAFDPAFVLTVGQQKNRFTHDRTVSSRYLNYLERAMLTNMFAVDYTPAVTAQGRAGKFSYYGGVFSNATGRDVEKYLTHFNSGYSLLGNLYYDLGKAWGLDNVTLTTSYVHSDFNGNATNMNRFDNDVAGAVILTNGRNSLVTEVSSGIGGDSGNAVGLNLQPSHFFSKKIQLVGRYQLAGSNSEEGLSPQKRYEKPSGFEPGDLYQAAYVGVNYYILRHRFKLMQGLEYSNMNGQEGWTTSLMVRCFWGPHSSGAFPANQILPLDFAS